MTKEEKADKIIAKGKNAIKRELIGCYKRIEYLEGKEYYEGIKKDILSTK